MKHTLLIALAALCLTACNSDDDDITPKPTATTLAQVSVRLDTADPYNGWGFHVTALKMTAATDPAYPDSVQTIDFLDGVADTIDVAPRGNSDNTALARVCRTILPCPEDMVYRIPFSLEYEGYKEGFGTVSTTINGPVVLYAYCEPQGGHRYLVTIHLSEHGADFLYGWPPGHSMEVATLDCKEVPWLVYADQGKR